MLRRTVQLLLGALLLALALPGTSAEARGPAGFMGVMADGPLLTSSQPAFERELGIMRASGVQTLRVVFNWADAQPSRGVAPSLSATDRIVAAAARHGLAVLPVVMYAPAWDAADRRDLAASPPSSPTRYGRYLRALVDRYGPRGSLWSGPGAPPRRPIRAWQVWNEPNMRVFWSRQPFARGYVALLRAAALAIRGADRGATVVTGGLTNSTASPAWTALEQLYRAGGRRWFDEVAVHPYTATPQHVVTTLEYTRRVMARYGDARKPVAVTELSWSSSGRLRRVPWDTTPRGQARELSAAYSLLGRARRRLRIAQVDWYTWLSPDGRRGQWNRYAGLRHVRGDHFVAKPALAAYRAAARQLAR